jgi:hypothetical protein
MMRWRRIAQFALVVFSFRPSACLPDVEAGATFGAILWLNLERPVVQFRLKNVFNNNYYK